MDYLFAFFILVCFVAFLVSLNVSNIGDKELLRLLSIIMLIGIIAIAIKYLFAYIGISILWLIIGSIIAFIVFLGCLCSSNDSPKDSCTEYCEHLAFGLIALFSVLTLIYVIFIISLHEVSIGTVRYEDIKKDVISTN
jgi:hypothetical protein